MGIPFSEIKNSTNQNEIIYTHVTPDGSAVLHFAITRMRKSIKVNLLPTRPFPVDFQTGIALLEMNVVEPLKLQALMQQDPGAYQPVLLMAHNDGSSSIIDGMEEYCACVARRHPTFLGKRLPFLIWSEYTVDGVPYSKEQINSLVNRQSIHNKLKPN